MEVTVLESDRTHVGPESSSPVFRGRSALAVTVDSLAPLGLTHFEQTRLTFRPSTPVEHYKTLRFAWHPGTSQVAVFPLLEVFVNGRQLSSLSLTTAEFWNHLSHNVADIENREWIVVELPLDFPALDEPVESISVTNWLVGTFYLDEISLLPGKIVGPGRVTAVQETRAPALPSAFALEQNYPNPFNSGTVISFALPTSGETELAVYNLVGQKVASLMDGVRDPGQYTLRWDGRDDHGRSLASGVYFYRLQAGEQIETRKLLLLR